MADSTQFDSIQPGVLSEEIFAVRNHGVSPQEARSFGELLTDGSRGKAAIDSYGMEHSLRGEPARHAIQPSLWARTKKFMRRRTGRKI